MADERAPKVWSVEEANALVPRLDLLVGVQMERATAIESLLGQLQRIEPGAMSPGPSGFTLEVREADAGDVRRIKRELVARIREYDAGWAEVQELGAVVKDPRSGLCDFYGRIDGKLVWLCWRFGELAIEHYHDLDAGFAGRKALTGSTKKLLLN